MGHMGGGDTRGRSHGRLTRSLGDLLGSYGGSPDNTSSITWYMRRWSQVVYEGNGQR